MSESGPRILVIDDEPQIRKFLRISLGSHGYQVIEAARGQEGVEKCATEQPALVVLDLGLPDIDGQDVILRIREWSTVPIVVLSVRAGEAEKVSALDRGANDYVTKPFGIAELLARIRAALRNQAVQAAGAAPPSEIDVGELHIDLARHLVRLAGQDVKLSKKEFELLRVLAQNAGRIVTHRQLLRDVWGPAQENEIHYLRVYVGHLREKLGDDSAAPKFILNEPGVGYRLIEPE